MAANNMDNNLKAPTGVYKNQRLMYACTTIVGFTVHLQTKDGKVWEGIFNTFSPEFTICLDLAIQIDPKLNSKDCLYAALKSGLQAKTTAFFDLKDIVRISVVDVDLNYATKDLFKLVTDADISGYDANKSGEHRQLESWQDDDGDGAANADTMLSLDEPTSLSNKNGSQNNSRGWDAQEMFRYNERVHKVTTTYDDKLTDYTVPLPKPNNTKDWRKKHQLASTIAQEIESNTKSQNRLAKEDEGDCEEEKFSAVLRPRPNSIIRSSADTSSAHEDGKRTGTANNPVPESAHHQQSPHQSNQQSQQHQQQSNQQQPQQQHQQQHRPSPLASSTQQSSLQTNRSVKEDKTDEVDNNKYRPSPARGNSGNQNGTHKNFPRRFERPRMDHNKHFDSLKNFGQKLTLAPSPRQPHHQNFNQVQNQMQNTSNSQNQSSPSSHQQQSQQIQQPQQKQAPQQQQHSQHQQPLSQQQQQQQQHQQPQQQAQHQQPQQPQQPQQQPQQSQQPPQPQQQQPPPPPQQKQPHQQQVPITQQQQAAPSQVSVTISSPAATTSTPSTVPNTSTISLDQRSDTTNTSTNQAKDHQSELARRSKLNPHAKEFVYKPRSPAINQGIQANGANQAPTSGAATIDPANSSPMSQAQHTPYYQPVSMFPVGIYPHQHQPHHAQFMPNHTHPHFQNQIHYMSPVPPHFAQQMSQRYHIRSNFQNYHRGGEHHNNVRPDYSQASMMAPTSTGQAFVPSPSGAPHLMNAYTTSQQPMIYNGPPQSMYPVVPTGFPQHVPHVMPNPPPYDGSVYMPQQQNYIANP